MLVIGGGGHALVSIEVLRACGHDVVGCLTRDGVGIGRPGPHRRRRARNRRRPRHARRRRVPPASFVAVGDNAGQAEAVGGRRGGRRVVGARRQPGRRRLDHAHDIDDGVLVMPGAVVNAARSPRTRRDRQHPRLRRPRLPDRRLRPRRARGRPRRRRHVGEGALIGIGASRRARPVDRRLGHRRRRRVAWSATWRPARRWSACPARPLRPGQPVSDVPAHPRGVHRQPLPLAAGRGAAASRAGRRGHRRRGLVGRPRRPAGAQSRPPAPPRRRRARCRRRRAPQPAGRPSPTSARPTSS